MGEWDWRLSAKSGLGFGDGTLWVWEFWKELWKARERGFLDQGDDFLRVHIHIDQWRVSFNQTLLPNFAPLCIAIVIECIRVLVI